MNLIQKPLADDQYVHDVFPKNLLVLHFTAGASAEGAFQSWAGTPERVGAPYIVDRDGKVYQTFDPTKWIFHLGQKTTNANDKRSVAIEIVNVGPLKRVNDDLMWWPENYTKRFCSASAIEDVSKFISLKQPYRGFLYYATYTPAQMTAVTELVLQVCKDHKIPTVLPPVEKRGAYDAAYFQTWKGIASHQNFRTDKYDVGPAFPWPLLEQALPVIS